MKIAPTKIELDCSEYLIIPESSMSKHIVVTYKGKDITPEVLALVMLNGHEYDKQGKK